MAGAGGGQLRLAAAGPPGARGLGLARPAPPGRAAPAARTAGAGHNAPLRQHMRVSAT
jgi:hypothetical protein